MTIDPLDSLMQHNISVDDMADRCAFWTCIIAAVVVIGWLI